MASAKQQQEESAYACGRLVTQEGDHAALCWQALRTTVTYAGTPTITNARSLSFPFRSPGAMEAD